MKWRNANLQRSNEYNKRWRAENPKLVQAISQRSEIIRKPKKAVYRKANASHIKARNAAYRLARADIIKAQGQAYYTANALAINERIKAAVAKNPELYKQLHKAAKHRRKVRLTNSGPVEKFKDIEIFERDNWTCKLCGKPVDSGLSHPHPMSVSLDHAKPIARGGGHTRDNVQCAHLRCNLSKRDRDTIRVA